MLQLRDEGKRVPDGGKENVAARLIGLGLDGKTHGVALLDDIPGEDVEGLLVAVKRGANVLCGAGLRTFATSPEHHDARTELGSEIEVVQHFAQRETAHLAVICREGAVAEDRV